MYLSRIKTIQIIKHQTYHYSSHPLGAELINTIEIIKRQYISNEYLTEKEIYNNSCNLLN